MTKMDTARHSALQLVLLVAFSIIVSGLKLIRYLSKSKFHMLYKILFFLGEYYIKYCSKVDVFFVYADICMEFVVGGSNAEIVSSQKVTDSNPDCPKCKSDSACVNCCKQFKPPLYGVPVCRNNTQCVCVIHSPLLNNIPSQTLTIAN